MRRLTSYRIILRACERRGCKLTELPPAPLDLPSDLSAGPDLSEPADEHNDEQQRDPEDRREGPFACLPGRLRHRLTINLGTDHAVTPREGFKKHWRLPSLMRPFVRKILRLIALCGFTSSCCHVRRASLRLYVNSCIYYGCSLFV